MLGDLLDAAHNLKAGGTGRTVALAQTALCPIDDLTSAYYLTLQVADRPAALGRAVRMPRDIYVDSASFGAWSAIQLRIAIFSVRRSPAGRINAGT